MKIRMTRNSGTVELCYRAVIISLWSLAVVSVDAMNLTTLPVKKMELDPAVQLYVAMEASFAGEGYVDLSQLKFQLNDSGSGGDTTVDNAPSVTYIDVVLVPMLDDNCYESEVGRICDWHSMGIGRKKDANSTATWFCCTSQAQETGLCNHEEDGHLLIDSQKFLGQSLNVTVPTSSEIAAWGDKLSVPMPFTFDIPDPGNYTVIMTNCDVQFGRPVVVSGPTEWVSFEADFEKFFSENVPFYLIMALLYTVLGGWYRYLMTQNQESRITLEEWIFALIMIGWGEVLFRFAQYAALKENDSFSTGFLTIGAILGGLKHGMSRCLLLLLALGWGVVHASVDPNKRAIVLSMTIVYIALKTIADILINMSDGDTSVGGLISLCVWFTWLIDLFFFVWIPIALLQTMKHLKSTNQSRKLERYRSLLRILGLAILLTMTLVALIIADFVYDGGIEISLLNITQGNEVNFFLILTFIAIVWKPNPMARDFVYAVELSAQEDEDGIIADLELTENSSSNNKPSATNENSADYNQFPVDGGEGA